MLQLALALVLLAPSVAEASFPGQNGAFVVATNSCYLERHLAKLSPKGGDLLPVTPDCPADADDEEVRPSYAFPEAAPDGRSLLALQDTFPQRYVTLHADGSNLTTVPIVAPPLAWEPTAGSLAPDGNRFAFEFDKYEKGYDTQPLLESRLDGSGVRAIRSAQWCGRGRSCNVFEDPHWSPDGKLIAVTVIGYGKAPKLKPGLWLIRATDGRAVRRVSKQLVADVDWAPDGKHVVYATRYYRSEFGGASGGNLYVVGRDGQGTRTLVHRKKIAETQPVWSPDGKKVAWISLDFGDGDVSFDVRPKLWRIPAKGGDRKLIKRLPKPYVEEGDYAAPHLTWLPR